MSEGKIYCPAVFCWILIFVLLLWIAGVVGYKTHESFYNWEAWGRDIKFQTTRIKEEVSGISERLVGVETYLNNLIKEAQRVQQIRESQGGNSGIVEPTSEDTPSSGSDN